VKKNLLVFLILLTAFLIRLILIPHPGFEADMAYWKGWGLAVADKGILWLVSSSNYNYPPAFAYLLLVVNKIYALIQSPYDLSYWTNTNLLYLFLIKIITIAADFGNAWLIYKIVSRLVNTWGFSHIHELTPGVNKHNVHELTPGVKQTGLFLALIYLLTPATFFDGALWGQVDQLGLFFFLTSLYLLLIERLEIASIIFTLSFLIKFQNLMFIPVYFLFIFKKRGIAGLFGNLGAAFGTFMAVTAPFWLADQMEFLLRLMMINADWFPHFSLNAFNIWWILSGLQGMQVTDRNLMIGITNAKSVGMLFFIFAYFTASYLILISRREDLLNRYIIASALIVFAFFHLLTESHERYQFHLLGLLPLIVVIDLPRHHLRNTIYLIIVSLFLFFNLYIAFYFNYPTTIYWPFSPAFAKTASLIISIFQIGLFLVFGGYILAKFFRNRHALVLLTVAVILTGVLTFQNLDFWLRRPISLTRIKPIASAQDYLNLVTNMTVDSGQGPQKWNRLSNNYYFYGKGLGSHADSSVYYNLNGKFSEFVSDYGIDTEGAAEAKVYFSVIGDNRELFKSKAVGRFETPKAVRVNIKGVRELVLRISRATPSIFGAHADWLEPMLIR